MRRIPTNLHGPVDYLAGLFLVVMPWLVGFAEIGGPATWLSVAIGLAVITYSLLTDYEWGVFGGLDMRAHLVLDATAGATLLLSWVYFGFHATTWWPFHLAVGVLGIAGAFITERKPQSSRPRIGRPRNLMDRSS